MVGVVSKSSTVRIMRRSRI